MSTRKAPKDLEALPYDTEHGDDDVHSDTNTHINETKYPNRWAKIRSHIKEPASEFFGTMILILFGNGVNCQV